MAVGISIYFSLGEEPTAWFAFAGFMAAVLIFLAAGRRWVALVAGSAVLSVSLGFATAQTRTAWVDAPRLANQIGYTVVIGRIRDIAPRSGGTRFLLDNLEIDGIGDAEAPARVRLTIRGKDHDLVPGDWIRVGASLAPPSVPVAPGAYDFARKAYFAGIGATGFTFGPPQKISAPEAAPLAGPWLWVASVRKDVRGRIQAALEGRPRADGLGRRGGDHCGRIGFILARCAPVVADGFKNCSDRYGGWRFVDMLVAAILEMAGVRRNHCRYRMGYF